ncbi:poly-gamma-glutamate hydrolase family protein [Mesorhizobium sp. M0146]|uniref:poly-gamma-glutamate hydrolase family protein n=1 Tax=unclassified Mesorhizobium TaxID=325217 RepID=UPI0033380612
MKKEFPNYAALKNAKEENKDYRVVVRAGSGTSSALVMTPHGGGIERHVSMVTAAVAGGDLDLYCFEGTMREGNAELHITSENFDEDRALELLKTKSTVVAIHGRADEGDADTIYLGGKDADLVTAIDEGLQAAGLKTKGSGHRFPGTKDSNVVNRGLTGKGAQLELPLSLRNRLAKEPDLLARFRSAVRNAMLALDADRRAQKQGEDPLPPDAGK